MNGTVLFYVQKYVQPSRLLAFLDRVKPPVRLRFPSEESEDFEVKFVQVEETLSSSSSSSTGGSASSKVHSIEGNANGFSLSTAELNSSYISKAKELSGESIVERLTRLLLWTRLSRAAVAGAGEVMVWCFRF